MSAWIRGCLAPRRRASQNLDSGGNPAVGRLSGPEPGDLDAAISGLISVGDDVGREASAPGAHGSAFDRISAFQTGFDGGTKRCAEFADNPPDYYEVPFTDIEDLATGGNLPVDTLTPLVTKDLEEYWATALTGYKPGRR